LTHGLASRFCCEADEPDQRWAFKHVRIPLTVDSLGMFESGTDQRRCWQDGSSPAGADYGPAELTHPPSWRRDVSVQANPPSTASDRADVQSYAQPAAPSSNSQDSRSQLDVFCGIAYTVTLVRQRECKIGMKLVLHNLTYHDCPVEVREKVTLTGEQRREMLRQMHRRDQIGEGLILQTCNRLEFYLYAKRDFDCRAFLGGLLAACGAEAVDAWAAHSRELSGMDVVRHLFEVTAGLDSQMVGENQILAQVKAAYTESLEARTSRLVFHRLLHSAFRVGKAVRTRTHINCGAVSIGLAAVELAREKVDLSVSKVMMIGAGENAELIVNYLSKAGVSGLIIANRDIEKARAMARRFDRAEAIGLSDIVSRLADVDVLISSTASPEHVLTRAGVEWSLAGRSRPLLIVDIAVPRDIDPAIGGLDCVRLYNIDDLDGQITANREKRNREVPKAQEIVGEFTAIFSQWYESLDLVPVISRLTQMGLELARGEAKRYAKDFGDANAEKLQAFAESLVRKVLHGPISFIKDGGGEPSAEQLQAIDLVNKMFLSQDEGDE